MFEGGLAECDLCPNLWRRGNKWCGGSAVAFFPWPMSSNESLVRLRRRGFALGCSAAVTSRVVLVESTATVPGRCLVVGADAGDAKAADAANDPTGCIPPVQRTRLPLRLVAFCKQSRDAVLGAGRLPPELVRDTLTSRIRLDWIRRGSCQREAVLSLGFQGCGEDRTEGTWRHNGRGGSTNQCE